MYSAYILAGSEITVECLPSEIVRPAPTPMPDNNVPVSIGMTAAEGERRLIIATLAHFDGSRTKAAEIARAQSQDAVQPPSRVPKTRLLRLPLKTKNASGPEHEAASIGRSARVRSALPATGAPAITASSRSAPPEIPWRGDLPLSSAWGLRPGQMLWRSIERLLV